MSENKGIYIGMYSPLSDEGLAMMAAITGHPHYGKDTPYIDSRLKAVHAKLEWEEGNVVGNRMKIYIYGSETQTEAETFAVLLYHLYELFDFPPKLKGRVVEAGEFEFSELCRVFLGMDGDLEPWLRDTPFIARCPACDADPDSFELQDQVYVCHSCEWVGDYQTEWPYLHVGLECLGRLDKYVSHHLAKMAARERTIEMYYGIGGSDGGSWYVIEMRVNFNLSEKEATALAYEKAYENIATNEGMSAAFVGVYCFWDDEMMEEIWKQEQEEDYEWNV